MSENQNKDKILELVNWIDDNESNLITSYDFFIGWERIFGLLFIIMFFTAEILNFVTASVTDKISIGLASLAVFMAFASIIIQTGESNMVEGRYKRALTLGKFDDTEKILLKALIKVRSKNDDFKLRAVYERSKVSGADIFTEKRLLEELYQH